MPLNAHPRWRSVLLGLTVLWCLTIFGAGVQAVATSTTTAQPEASSSKQIDTGQDLKLPKELRWLWDLGDGGNQSHHLQRAMIAALALLLAFLTVVEIWRIPPQGTSLAEPSKPQKGEGSQNTAQPAEGAARPGIGNLFDSNFSRTVLTGLGGLAAVSFIDPGSGEAGNEVKAYYLVLFVGFFLTGLLLSAIVRGFGEAVRSRIVLNRPAVLWPQGPNTLSKKWRYWARRAWHWLASFRATFLVFVDTAFNVLMGKNQLQTAIFSETITDLHESMLEAAERTREEVHRAVIRALLRKGVLPAGLPHEENIRVGISLLSSDESSVYYIAWERGCLPQRFDQHSVAWVSAFTGEARWYRSDPPGTPEGKRKLSLIYQDATLVDNTQGVIPGPGAKIPLKQYYQPRGAEDYEGFIVLPMPWINRGKESGHRRGALHISFKQAKHMEALWENLEAPAPNYQEWKGLLVPAEERQSRKSLPEPEYFPAAGPAMTLMEDVLGLRHQVMVAEPRTEEPPPQSQRITPKDAELCSVLHQALEVLGRALSHFDDEVYEIYVRSRRPSMEIPR